MQTDREKDRCAEQRQAKREQAEVYDLSTPPRRSDVEPPRTCEVGVQATFDMCVIDTQTETSLPGNVPAIWHCRIPKSVIDMPRTQVVDAADDRDEEDEISSADVAPPSSDEDLGQDCPDSSVTTVAITLSDDASREVASHPPDEAGGSRNVSEPVTDMEIEDILMSPEHIDDDPMSPGQESVSSTQSYFVGHR